MQEKFISPTEDLRQEHEVIREMVDELALLARDTKGPSDIEPLWQFVNQAVHFFEHEMRTHQWREETGLFTVYEAVFDGASGLTDRLREEHAAIRGRVLQLRSLAEGLDTEDLGQIHSALPRLREAAQDIQSALGGHMDTEDGVLFPQAERMLTPQELDVVGLGACGMWRDCC